MNTVLFLTHRIPYPPNKGDKIRSFNFLKALSENNKIILGTFIDEDTDWQYEDVLRTLCDDIRLVKLNRKKRKIVSLIGLAKGTALSVEYYKSRSMYEWVEEAVSMYEPDVIFIFSSTMCQYIPAGKSHAKCIVDFVDMDSEKWHEYAEKKSFIEKFVYKRESAYLFEYEKQCAERADMSIFITKNEADFFIKKTKYKDKNIRYVENGVDSEYFSPEHDFINPFPDGTLAYVFTGAMDYWANEHAVQWFANDIFPKISESIKNSIFYIVGSNPSSRVTRLSRKNGVVVTGYVDDVRPYLKYATCVVATLQIARGIQNKVLEAMAMRKAVLGTTAAMNGIEHDDLLSPMIADDVDSLVQLGISASDTALSETMGIEGRNIVLDKYSWKAKAQKLLSFIESSSNINSKSRSDSSAYID